MTFCPRGSGNNRGRPGTDRFRAFLCCSRCRGGRTSSGLLSQPAAHDKQDPGGGNHQGDEFHSQSSFPSHASFCLYGTAII